MAEQNILSVHRCRFVDFNPSAITALAFPPLPLPSSKVKDPVKAQRALKFGLLAIGRTNGNIELCEWTGSPDEFQSHQAWAVEKTLLGPYPSKVDSMTFAIRYPEKLTSFDVPSCTDLRLFTSGGGSELIEWDLDVGCIKRTLSSQGGSIWSMGVNPASNLLALGCEDGSIRLVSLELDTLSHLRRFDRVKGRLLSLAWGPPVPRQSRNKAADSSDDEDEDDWTDTWIVTGGSDSSLRKWDVASGRVIDRMGTDKIRGERTLVWAVGVLGDGTIISGDSMGIVKFWDAKTCTQLQSFQGHGADVLCLTIAPDGSTVYTTGVDQKITQFAFVKSTSSHDSVVRSSSRWVQSCSRRLHSHDVRALAIWPPYTPLSRPHQRRFPIDVAPVLASGGLDMSVVLTPAAPASSTISKIVNPLATSVSSTFEDSYNRRLAYSSGPASTSALRLARSARLLLCMGDNTLNLWRINAKPNKSEEIQDDLDSSFGQGGWERALKMELNVQTNLVASVISNDGRWLAASDFYESRLFELVPQEHADLKPKRLRDFSNIIRSHLPSPGSSTGASAFLFTPDSSKLVMASTAAPYVLIIDLSSGHDPQVLGRFDHHCILEVLPGERMVKSLRKTNGRGRRRRGAGNDQPPQDDDMDMDESIPNGLGSTHPADVQENAADVDEGTASDEADFPGPELKKSNSTVSPTITRMAISPDGQWLATTDSLCRTHIYNLDSIKHHCTLPSFPHPVHALAFNSSYSSMLVLGFPDNSLQIYDVEARQFPAWFRELCSSPPRQLADLHEPLLGVAFEPLVSSEYEPRHALFWGSTWIFQVKLDMPPQTQHKRKRYLNASRGQAGSSDSQEDSKLITYYRPLLFVDFVAPGELVVVERPLVDILEKLPPAYFKPKYGMT